MNRQKQLSIFQPGAGVKMPSPLPPFAHIGEKCSPDGLKKPECIAAALPPTDDAVR